MANFIFEESSQTKLPAELVNAYVETDFIVYVEPALYLNIGFSNKDLIKLHRKFQCSCSAFITAFNPYSVETALEENNLRQKQLSIEIEHSGLKYFSGIGQHPSGVWPGEPSFLVLGIPLESARGLGIRFEQNAIVWIGENGIPTLELLR